MATQTKTQAQLLREEAQTTENMAAREAMLFAAEQLDKAERKRDPKARTIRLKDGRVFKIGDTLYSTSRHYYGNKRVRSVTIASISPNGGVSIYKGKPDYEYHIVGGPEPSTRRTEGLFPDFNDAKRHALHTAQYNLKHAAEQVKAAREVLDSIEDQVEAIPLT